MDYDIIRFEDYQIDYSGQLFSIDGCVYVCEDEVNNAEIDLLTIWNEGTQEWDNCEISSIVKELERYLNNSSQFENELLDYRD